MTRTSFIRILKIGVSSIAIIIIIAYALWRSLSYARGPHIIIQEPSDWAIISSSSVIVRGRVERANSIYLNGKPIFIDEMGVFSESILVFPGLNLITVIAHDQFDREIEEKIRLTGISP